jgi:DNA-binding transcriptional regulator YiaG
MLPADLIAIRVRLGLSQAALAAKLGVNWNTVAHWEQGRHPISKVAALAIERIAEELGK